MFPAEPDREALAGSYADWLAASMRSAFLTGSAGLRDAWKALMGDWGFDLGDTRGVVLWQGDEDDIVTPAHAHWLADPFPAQPCIFCPGKLTSRSVSACQRSSTISPNAPAPPAEGHRSSAASHDPAGCAFGRRRALAVMIGCRGGSALGGKSP